MEKKILIGLGVVSAAAIAFGYALKFIDPENLKGTVLYLGGWMLSLLIVGYYSTPSGTAYGKVAFAFVVLMVAGIVMKILHFGFGNETIIFSLIGLAITYGAMWYKDRKTS